MINTYEREYAANIDSVDVKSSSKVDLILLREFMLAIDSLEWRLSIIMETETPPFASDLNEYFKRTLGFLNMLREQIEYLDHVRLGHDCVSQTQPVSDQECR